MDFSPSPRAAELLPLVSDFIREEVEPVAAEYHRQVTESAASGTWAESPILERAAHQGPGARPVEPLPAGRARRRRTPSGSAPTAAPG